MAEAAVTPALEEIDVEAKAAEVKDAKRREIEAKVAAAKAAREMAAQRDAAIESKKKEIEEKGTSYFGDHAGITCDGCATTPIFGYRYRCKQCPNHDICETCYDSWGWRHWRYAQRSRQTGSQFQGF